MKDTLIQLSKGVLKGPAADLVPVLFGERPPTMTKKDVSFSPFNSNLDHSQVLNFIKFSFLQMWSLPHCLYVYSYTYACTYIVWTYTKCVCVPCVYLKITSDIYFNGKDNTVPLFILIKSEDLFFQVD